MRVEQSSQDGHHVAVAPLPSKVQAATSGQTRRWPPWGTDVVISLVILGLSVWDLAQNSYRGGGLVTGPVALLITVVASLALLLRRRYPVAVALLALVAHLVTMAFLPITAAFYALGAYGKNRLVIWLTAIVGVLAPTPLNIRGHWSFTSLGYSALSEILLAVLPLLVGLYMGTRRALLAGWVDRAQTAEREQAMIAERARAEERTRIAREMHDVVAHQVSLIVVHAGALQTIAARDPAQAVRAADTIQTVGRQALEELRHMIGVLRVGPPDNVDASQRPQPTLRDVATLVDASRAAGLDVRLHVEGEQHKLPDRIERAVYRVVQEALTNVHKHAGGSQAEVVLSYESHQLQATVSNTAPPTEFRRSLPSGGQGLIGLTERMELVGGTIHANPLPDGGFRVAVQVPTQEAT